MVGNRTTRTAVLVAVGVVAAATVATVLLLGGAEQVQEPSVGGAEQVQEPSVGGAEQVQEPEPGPPEESAQKAAAAIQAEDAPATPAMSTANDVAPLAESTVTAAADSAARVDGQVAGGSNESSGPASAVMSTDEPAPDVEFALEIVEATDSDFGPAAGGAHQETPVEQAGSDGLDTGSGDLVSAQGEVYTWHDGDRTLRARLQLDLVLIGDGSITSKGDVVADTGHGQIVRGPGGNGQPTDVEGESDAAGGGQPDSTGGSQPVFLSESGELVTLPGGVILVLDADWTVDDATAFFARNDIAPSRVSELDYLTNGFFVETDPGFASLDLANALAAQVGVELSSPNWWRERTAK